MPDETNKLPELNVDGDLDNADWLKRTPDSMAEIEALERFEKRTGIEGVAIDHYATAGDEEPAKDHDCEECSEGKPCPKCEDKDAE